MGAKRKISLPIAGILSILAGIYYQCEPRILLVNEFSLTTKVAKIYDLKKNSINVSMEAPLKNKSIKGGYIAKVEVHPVSVCFDKYKIQQVRCETKKLSFLESENVEINFTLILDHDSVEVINEVATSGKYRVTLYDNYNNIILNEIGSTAYYDVSIEYKKK